MYDICRAAGDGSGVGIVTERVERDCNGLNIAVRAVCDGHEHPMTLQLKVRFVALYDEENVPRYGARPGTVMSCKNAMALASSARIETATSVAVEGRRTQSRRSRHHPAALVSNPTTTSSDTALLWEHCEKGSQWMGWAF